MRLGVRGEKVRWQDDVVVDEHDDVAAGAGDAAIARRAAIGHRLVDARDVKPFRARDHFGRGIGRAVVDDDRFERRRLALRGERRERAFEERGAVLRRDDDREAHRRHQRAAPAAQASSASAIRPAAPAWPAYNARNAAAVWVRHATSS